MPDLTHSFDTATLAAQAAEDAAVALAEDVGDGDISATLIDASALADAQVITRDAGIFCGHPWVSAVARAVDPRIEITWHVTDGQAVQANDVLFELHGPARALLTAERTMLNFVQLLSGTASSTARYVALLAGTPAQLLDTRKTVPGLRVAQKYAVTCGGGRNHRLGLYDAYLLKENHIAAAGGITAAVHTARAALPERLVEVEVETLEELREAMAAGADIAMVDNFTLEDTRTAVAESRGRLKLEASGGIDEKTITDIARTGVDYISIGALTKQVQPLDLSMRMAPTNQGPRRT